jgi:hypothetical protein
MWEEYREYVPNVHFELIPIKNLVSNQGYQRRLSMRHVENAVESFDPYQINPVKVSRRDGVNYVFDGQHTAEIVAREAGSRDVPVWCMIYDDLNYQQEACVFANQKKFSRPLSSFEIFMANIEAGEEIELTIKALVDSYSLTLTNYSKGSSNICAVAALEFIFRKYGYHVLDQTLYIALSTWEGDPVSLCASILKGIARLLVSFGSNLKMDLFVERLSRVSAKEIVRSARERNNGTLGYAEALLSYYNKKTKYPLRWSKLYSARGDDEGETDEIDELDSGSPDFLEQPEKSQPTLNIDLDT